MKSLGELWRRWRPSEVKRPRGYFHDRERREYEELVRKIRSKSNLNYPV